MKFALMIHGGAGPIAGRDYTEAETHLGALAATGEARLRQGDSALDVVERMVVELELSGLYVAGRGSAPNSAGEVELDASIMDGERCWGGGVAAVRDLLNPVSAARLVLEQSSHVLLAGRGAREFAVKHGLALVEDPASYYRTPVGLLAEEMSGDVQHGTVGAVAMDQRGRLAAATSTGGTLGKLRGRVGDSPLIGPGTWADDQVCVSCTGIGEHIILAGGAYDIAARQRYAGSSLKQALAGMLSRVKELGGDAGAIAIDRDGNMAFDFNSDGLKRACVSSSQPLMVGTFQRPD